MKFLISCGGGIQGYSLLRMLKGKAASVVITDSNEDCISSCFAESSYQLTAEISSPEYISKLKEISVKEAVQAIIPATSLDLTQLSNARSKFEAAGIFLLSHSNEILQLSASKSKLYSSLDKANLPVLQNYQINELKNNLPIYAKPDSGWGSKGCITLNSENDIATFEKQNSQNYVFQRKLTTFREYSVDLAFTTKSFCLGYVLRERVQTSGGYAILSRTIVSPDLTSLISKFIEYLGQFNPIGFLNLQIIENENSLYISDLNPRFGTSSSLELLDFSLEELLGLAAPQQHSFPDETLLLRPLEMLSIPKISLKEIAAVIFDLDDTIHSHRKWFFEKTCMASRRCFDEKMAFKILKSAIAAFEAGAKRDYIDFIAAQCSLSTEQAKEFLLQFKDSVPDKCSPYTGFFELINSLKKRGIKTALLTNGSKGVQQQKVSSLSIGNCFDSIHILEATNSQKPASSAFLAIAEDLAVNPDNCIMIGNEILTDILGAIDSGYRLGIQVQHDDTFCQTKLSEREQSFLPSEIKERIVFLRSFNELRKSLF